MVTVPAATPETTPVLLTEAIDELDDTHGLVLAAVADPVSAVVDPTHTFNVPLIVGKAFTVINPDTVLVFLQPLLLVTTA